MDKATLAQHFKGYRREFNETRHFYLPDPRSLNTLKECTYHGSHAARYAAELKAMIETMEAYQQLIYDRVQELTTAQYHLELHLTREKKYCSNNKVFYYMEVKKVFDTPGINPETIYRAVYPGTERKKALADFAAYQKTHAGIVAIKDIEKAKWER